MKKSITIITTFFLMMNATFAITRTLSNSPVGGAQHSTLLAAYNACNNGDTLLIEGTDLNYEMNAGGWGKSLVVIGGGVNTQKNNPNFKATLLRVSIGTNDFAFNSSSGGSKFYGITFNNWPYLSAAVSNLTFEDCLFGRFNFNDKAGSNITFKNCVFGNPNDLTIDLPTTVAATGITILNCVFNGYIRGNSNGSNVVNIDHCLFLATTVNPLIDVYNIQIKNSIFMNVAAVQTPASTGNFYLNNISRLNATWPSGSGNLSNTNPLFTTYTFGTTWAATHDYHLQAGSPALTNSSDGTQVGVHGGLTNFSENIEPLIVPIMRTLIINNSTINPNGTLNVQINASKPNDN